MTLNIADLFEAVADAIPRSSSLDSGRRAIELRRTRTAIEPTRSSPAVGGASSLGSTSVFTCATASSTSKRSWLA